MNPDRLHRDSADSNPKGFHGVECFTAAWISGLLLAFVFSNHTYLLVFCIVFLLIGGAVCLFYKRVRRFVLPLGIGLLCANCVWTIYDNSFRQPQLAMIGETCELTAKITDARTTVSDSIRYTIFTKIHGKRMVIDWYGDETLPMLAIGDTVRMQAEFSEIPSDYLNHAAQYAAGQGKYLRIYRADVLEITQNRRFSLKQTLRDYRVRMSKRIQAKLPSDESALLLAMLFGDKDGLADEDSAALYRTGIGHITAVSGLHLVFFCSLLNALLKLLYVSPKRRFFVNIIAVIVFSAMVDSAVSVYRAGVMFLLAQAAPLFGRYPNTPRALCIAMLGCTLFSPYVVGSASFWLSVSGVVGIGVLAPWMTEGIPLPDKHSPWRAPARVGRELVGLLCVSVAVFPASILFCGESSLFSPVCNLVILPLSVGALFLAMLTVCTGGLTAFLLPAAGLLCRMVLTLANFVSELPYSHLQVRNGAVTSTLLVCVVFVGFVWIFARNRKQFAFAVLCCAVVLSAQLAFQKITANNQLRIAVLGSKSNAVSVISVGGQTVVADFTGNPKNAEYAAQYLADCELGTVDFLYCPSRNAAAYDSSLGAVGEVCLSKGGQIRENARICGCIPTYEGTVSVSLGDAELMLHPDNAFLQFCGRKIQLLPVDTEISSPADAVLRYGKGADDDCRNVIWIISSDGRYTVRPLT